MWKQNCEKIFGNSLVLETAAICCLVNRYAYDARLEEATPHTLRHSFGENPLDVGLPLDRVVQPLRYESVDTTRIYTTPSQQDLQREVEKIASHWEEATSGR
jgi:integrase/recombinase XerC